MQPLPPLTMGGEDQQNSSEDKLFRFWWPSARTRPTEVLHWPAATSPRPEIVQQSDYPEHTIYDIPFALTSLPHLQAFIQTRLEGLLSAHNNLKPYCTKGLEKDLILKVPTVNYTTRVVKSCFLLAITNADYSLFRNQHFDDM